MLTGCGGITGKSVRALARGCSGLRDLSLSGCGGVGNGDLKELAKGCTNLRHLNIAECSQVRKKSSDKKDRSGRRLGFPARQNGLVLRRGDDLDAR